MKEFTEKKNQLVLYIFKERNSHQSSKQTADEM